MATIRYINDSNGEIILPVTHERGVIDSNGVSIESKINSCENLNNKVNTITENSTNNQYPSAKGVYDYVNSSMQNMVSFPEFQIDENMHLKISSLSATSLSLFSVNEFGHLIMEIN